MKITFEKNIRLFMATVYMKIKKNVKREDIQEYLKGKHFSNPLINSRIDNYLKDLGIYDSDYQLTDLGKDVKESSLLPTPEEGKYRIWYSEKDAYFGNSIFYFYREFPHDNSTVEKLDLGFNKTGHFSLPVKESKNETGYFEFTLLNTDLTGRIDPKPVFIATNLILESGKQSYCYFLGHFGKDNQISIKPDNIRRTDNLDEVITEILPNYDTEYKRLMVKFNESYKDFEQSHYQCNWRGFSGEIDNVKLMPSDIDQAIIWRDFLLKEKVKEKYLSPDDFKSVATEINDKPAFEKYKDLLTIPESAAFKTDSKTQFWHLKAPIDLNPNGLQ